MTVPTVSVVIATYNRGPRIATTLDSVLAQTVRPAEVVVVDDCSPDRTGDWVAANYPDVRVVRAERNGGTSAARNVGARAATSEVLVFLDHDDILHPHAVETLLGLLTAFPEARAAFADHRYVNTANGITYPDHHTAQPAFHRMRAVPTLRATDAGRVYGRPMFAALLHGNILQQPWAVYRNTFLSLGGFAEDVRYCEDWDLYLRVARAVPVAVCDQVISDHVIEGENLHLAAGQEAMHQRVIRRVLRQERFSPRVQWVMRRRLGQYLKAEGDRAADARSAWRAYLRSFAAWPLDAMVAARALAILPVKALAGRAP